MIKIIRNWHLIPASIKGKVAIFECGGLPCYQYIRDVEKWDGYKFILKNQNGNINFESVNGITMSYDNTEEA